MADNWLLAKKPLNNYLCASCESVIKGELDKRSNFIAWNKYPSRDEKNYRMGHGFSKMLQLVNDDIMRNTTNDSINYNGLLTFLNSDPNLKSIKFEELLTKSDNIPSIIQYIEKKQQNLVIKLKDFQPKKRVQVMKE